MPSEHHAVALMGIRAPLGIVKRPTVKPQADEVLIRVEWYASSPLDIHQNDGGLLVNSYPQGVGCSTSGEIIEIGSDVSSLKIGDKVFGFTWRTDQEKGQQEFITAPSYLFAPIPSNITPQQAATIPDNFATAWTALVVDLGLTLPFPKPDDYVPPNHNAGFLVWGGSSSVGQYVIQILRHYGYKNIVVTASSKHHKYLSSLGATSLVDYTSPDIHDQLSKLEPFSYVFDCVNSQQGSLTPISQIVKGGTIVAGLLPVVIRDPSETDAPQYSFDISSSAPWAEGVVTKGVSTFEYLANEFHKTNLQSVILPKLVADGVILPNRTRIVEGSTLLERAQNAIDLLRAKGISGERLVWRVTEAKPGQA